MFGIALVVYAMSSATSGQLTTPSAENANCARLRKNCAYPIEYDPIVWSGELKSPNYPEPYCNNLDCKVKIQPGPEGTAIRINIETFTTERSHDYLSVQQYWGGNFQPPGPSLPFLAIFDPETYGKNDQESK